MLRQSEECQYRGYLLSLERLSQWRVLVFLTALAPDPQSTIDHSTNKSSMSSVLMCAFYEVR